MTYALVPHLCIDCDGPQQRSIGINFQCGTTDNTAVDACDNRGVEMLRKPFDSQTVTFDQPKNGLTFVRPRWRDLQSHG